MRLRLLLAGGIAWGLLGAPPSIGADWPEWRGKARAGVWAETGIVERFPEDGLEVTWRTPIGEGYAGPAVANGRVFVPDFVRDEGVRGTERLLCLDETTGKILWKREWPVDYGGTEPVWANGPRATPTVSGKRVCFVGGMARLGCYDVETGATRWEHDLVETHGASIPNWGVASAPVVFGKRLVALVGGRDGATVVAFELATGKERWRAISEEGDPGYAPPVIVDGAGAPRLIVWHPKAIYSLDPRDGDVLWRHPFEVGMAMTVATPVVVDDRLLVSSFFDGALMLELSAKPPGASELWRRKGTSEQPGESRGLHALITTPILDEDFVYGIDSYGELRGIDAKTGERVWASMDLTREQARWSAGLIVRHEDRYVINTDRGDLVFARFSPEGYEEIDRTALIEPTSRGGGRRELDAVHWSHPAYANRHVVVRNDREILRASLARSDYPADSDRPGR